MAQAQRVVRREDPLPDASAHCEGFRQTREAQRSALAEDYVELIADMKRLNSLFCSSAYAQLEALAPAPGDPQTQR